MRSLAQPRTLAVAGMAALITSLACYPRLAGWSERPHPALYLSLVLLWATFVLWSFVFGWHFQYTGQHVLSFRWQPRLWTLATSYGLIASLLLWLFIDPQLRLTSPGNYPTNLKSWMVMSLFTLAFDPLFLCFAPFAFFMRLTRRQTTALIMTVLFGAFILFVRLSSSTTLPPAWVLLALMVKTVVAGFFSVYFYLNGGAWIIWWLGVLLQLRLLIGLPGAD